MSRMQTNGPGAAGTALRAGVVLFPQGTAPHSPANEQIAIQPDPFPPGVIWERLHRGELIRFSVSEMKGTRFADVRRMYRRNGEWLHSNKGCTMPLSALRSFYEGLGAYLAATESGEAQDAA